MNFDKHFYQKIPIEIPNLALEMLQKCAFKNPLQ